MAGKGVEIAVQRLHVDAQVGHPLAAVQQHLGVHPMGPGDDLGNRNDGAQGVGHMGDRHQLGARAQDPVQGVQAQFAVVGDRNHLEHDALLVPQHLPGHDVGVVLHLRNHHLVAFGQEPPSKGGGDQVDGLGGVACEDDLVAVGGVDEAPHRLAGFLETSGGPFAQIVDAPVDVGVFVLVHVAQGVDYLARLLGRGGAVQEHQRLAVHDFGQDREIAAHPFHVVGPGKPAVGNRRGRGYGVHGRISSASSQPMARWPRAWRTASSLISARASSMKAPINRRRADASSRPRERR